MEASQRRKGDAAGWRGRHAARPVAIIHDMCPYQGYGAAMGDNMMPQEAAPPVSPDGTEDPDTDLVRRTGAGDQRAAAMLVQRHLPKMLNVARAMLGDATEAEDVAQEVFMKVWLHASKWQPGKARFETWMHRVAINLCYDRLRRKREIYTAQLPEREDGNAPGAEKEMIDDQRRQRVQEAILALPPRQRAALTLCHLRQISNIDAAAIMDISVEALESLLARGRRGLRKLLADEAAMLLEE